MVQKKKKKSQKTFKIPSDAHLCKWIRWFEMSFADGIGSVTNVGINIVNTILNFILNISRWLTQKVSILFTITPLWVKLIILLLMIVLVIVGFKRFLDNIDFWQDLFRGR